MKTLVVYQSKYGSTEQYARWIADALSADIVHIDKATSDMVSPYDVVIFGSYVRMGKIVSIKYISRMWPVLSTKKVIVFSVSGAPAGSKVLVEAFKKGIPEDMAKCITVFQFQGRLIKKDLVDTVLMFCATWIFYIKLFLKGKRPTYNPYAPFDKMDKKHILPLVESVKRLQTA